jgi:hypothetical protein
MNNPRTGLSSVFILFFLLLPVTALFGQETGTEQQKNDSSTGYEQQARQLVEFLEYSFNTLGDTNVTIKEKDIIINNSYLKFFRDDKVQIEDDLDENRIMVTNKNVQAYLKDITFFYKWVKFEFTIEEFSQEINEKGQVYFKITLNRNLQGKTLDDSLVNNNRIRYIEINLNDDQKDLKVASIYTTKLSEEGDMASWWLMLNDAWQHFFLSVLGTQDSLAMQNYLDEKDRLAADTSTVEQEKDTLPEMVQFPFSLIRKIWLLEEVDLSGNPNITDLGPLKKLSRLKHLDISNTLIGDLTPLRSLAGIEKFDCSGTTVKELDPLRYSLGMKELILSHTLVDRIEGVSNFHQLEVLSFSNTPVDNLEAVSELANLKELRCAQTRIDYLVPIATLQNLKLLDLNKTAVLTLEPVRSLNQLNYINIGNTLIDDLGPLKNMTGLQYIYMDNTPVNSLEPLISLPSLKRIYCDRSLVTRETASSFMLEKPGTLVIYETEELTGWWNELDTAWQNVFTHLSGYDSISTIEQLHEILLIQKININHLQHITSIEPVGKLINLHEIDLSNTSVASLDPLRSSVHLRKLDASSTQVHSIGPLKNLASLSWLDISNTPVAALGPLAFCTSLETLNIRSTQVDSISGLADLPNLARIDADGSLLERDEVIRFKEINDRCQVIFQTKTLETWWAGIDQSWKDFFRGEYDLSDPPSTEQLHRLVDLQELSIPGSPPITDLQPLTQMIRLVRFSITGTMIAGLDPLSGLPRLEKVSCTENRVTSIMPLISLTGLKYLDISNTRVADHDQLQVLISLEYLNISGTPVKNLKWITPLQDLGQLDCYNTDISSLNELTGLKQLSTIKCYHSKLNEKKVQKFQSLRPDIEVIFY